MLLSIDFMHFYPLGDPIHIPLYLPQRVVINLRIFSQARHCVADSIFHLEEHSHSVNSIRIYMNQIAWAARDLLVKGFFEFLIHLHRLLHL